MDRSTIDTLAQLSRRLSDQGLINEANAVREALNELGYKEGFITTGMAAEQLGVSVPTIRRWAERGTLDGFDTGTRLLVSQASVDRLVRIRANLEALDEEGNPTPEEIELARERYRNQDGSERVA